MTAPDDQARLLDADDAALEQARIEVVGNAADDEIVAGGQKLARQNLTGLHLHADLNAWVAASDVADRRNRKLDCRRGHRAEEDGSALALLQVGDLAVGLAHFEEDGAGPPRQARCRRA